MDVAHAAHDPDRQARVLDGAGRIEQPRAYGAYLGTLGLRHQFGEPVWLQRLDVVVEKDEDLAGGVARPAIHEA